MSSPRLLARSRDIKKNQKDTESCQNPHKWAFAKCFNFFTWCIATIWIKSIFTFCMNSQDRDQGQLKNITGCVFVSVWCFWRGLIPNHNCCQQVHKCRRIIIQNDDVFHQMIVSFLFLALFARVKVFEAQALIRSASPNPSSLLRQASL